MTSTRSAGHSFREHVSELALRVHAATECELFVEAGRALAEQLRRPDPGTLSDAWRSIEIQGNDVSGMLVDWLNELIYLAEAELWVPAEFRSPALTDGIFSVEARGVQLERAPSLIKAATFHGLQVDTTDSGVQVEVIFDV